MVDRINQQLSWVPPFTLSGVPILHYRISINSNTNTFPVIITNSTTLYKNGTPSGNSTATIRAVNAVGEGQAASLEYTHIGVGITSGVLSSASSSVSSIASSLDMVSFTKRLTLVHSTSTMTSNGVLITITASSSKTHYPSTTHHLSKAHSTVISNTMPTTTSVSKTAHKALTTFSSPAHYSSTAYYPSKPHSTVNINTVPTTSSAANSSSSAFIISGAVGVILLIIIMIIITLLIILAIKKGKGRTNVEAKMYSTAEATPTYDEIADKPTTPMETDINVSVHPNTAYQESQ